MISGMIECVPNISEGRNNRIVEKLSEVVEKTSGVKLLHVDSGFDTNRTVFTLAGMPEVIEAAVFSLVQQAVRSIDMRKHRGSHPRIGAVDVIPLIPLDPVKTGACITMSHGLAERIWRELEVPVYLYGKAAGSPHRVRLPDIRKGQYEALKEKMEHDAWKPDYGNRFNEKSGATVIGVRDFMLAYNVNLDTTAVQKARYIAGRIRSSGYTEIDQSGEVLKRTPGILPFCQADGWYLPEYGYCQVTMNLHNLSVTGFHHAFEAVKRMAEALGVGVRGSELIGMTPLAALTETGRYYLQDKDASDKEAIEEAVRSLGLNDSAPFDPNRRIVEYRLADM